MFVGQAGNDNGPLIAIADGAGIAFLYQYETGYTGPTVVPDASLDVTVLLGDVTVTGVFVFPEGGDGRDGDFWLDVITADLYGPKAGGVWPPPLNIRGFDSSIYHTFTGGLVLSSSDPAGSPLTLTGGPEPDAGYLSPGQVAVWFDPAPGTGGMRFKMTDSAGTVTDVSLP